MKLKTSWRVLQSIQALFQVLLFLIEQLLTLVPSSHHDNRIDYRDFNFTEPTPNAPSVLFGTDEVGQVRRVEASESTRGKFVDEHKYIPRRSFVHFRLIP